MANSMATAILRPVWKVLTGEANRPMDQHPFIKKIAGLLAKAAPEDSDAIYLEIEAAIERGILAYFTNREENEPPRGER